MYVKRESGAEILSLRSFVDDGAASLKQLLCRLGAGSFRFPKVHPAEISSECLEGLGFRPAGGQLQYQRQRARIDLLVTEPAP